MARLAIDSAAFGWLIAATQLGFIAGTLAFAATGLADRFGASRIFAVSCVAGAATNAALALPGVEYPAAWLLRFAVGLCLAGIYPLGMKMIVQWVGGRPAAALGWLVGMLTLGTAMPHALRASGASWPWEAVLIASSLLALVGAALVAFLGDGPFAAPPRRPGRRRRGATRRGLAGVSGADLSRLGVRLLRPHVGALCVLERAAVAVPADRGRAGAPRRRRAFGRAAQLRRHRRRRRRLRPGRAVEPAHRQRARRCARAGRFGPDVPSVSVVT